MGAASDLWDVAAADDAAAARAMRVDLWLPRAATRCTIFRIRSTGQVVVRFEFEHDGVPFSVGEYEDDGLGPAHGMVMAGPTGEARGWSRPISTAGCRF